MVTMRQRRRLQLPAGVPRAVQVAVEVCGERRPDRAERPARATADFGEVSPEHAEMDARLENWGRWCNSRERPKVAAGFSMAGFDSFTERSDRTYGALTQVSVDGAAAQVIAKAVAHLPGPHRSAVQWNYVKKRDPRGAARSLGVTLPQLAALVIDGRQMLINRGV